MNVTRAKPFSTLSNAAYGLTLTLKVWLRNQHASRPELPSCGARRRKGRRSGDALPCRLNLKDMGVGKASAKL